MQIKRFDIEGLLEIIPDIYEDDRGYFFESFNSKILQKEGLNVNFVQDNQSFSHKGILRGIHYQRKPFEQGKLVRVIKGRVLDVAVDLRSDSRTFGMHQKIILDGKTNNFLYVPEGFGHAFYTLEDSIFFYKCTNFYSKEHETGITWNDPDLAIDWNVDNPSLSDKDSALQSLKSFLGTIN